MGTPTTTGSVSRSQAATGELLKIMMDKVAIKNRPTSEGDAVSKATEAAETEASEMVSKDYDVEFELYKYQITELEGKFSVHKAESPLDVVSDERPRKLTIIHTAVAELDKIDVSGFQIGVPFSYDLVEEVIEKHTLLLAQNQISEGYSINFNKTNYIPNCFPDAGVLIGTVTVSNNAYPDDSASNNKTITAVYTPTTAEEELAKINVVAVVIDLPRYSNTVEEKEAVVAKVNLAAQLQIAPGYDVSFEDSSYTPGSISGIYAVTNSNDLSDTIRQTEESHINVNAE
ncbi:MAG: hypothetical protein LBV08_02455 [Clostridiales bacterium]|nr:hypothetical protein [Clostridiales bacterium]